MAAGPGVRVDTMIYQGYAVPLYYDSPLAQNHRPCGNS